MSVCNDCKGDGRCERFGIELIPRIGELCQRNEGGYRRGLERGWRPGVGKKKRSSRAPCGGCDKAWNLIASGAAFVADGFRTVSADEYRHRLAICETCEHRDGPRCGLCSCFVAIKAKGRAWDCPDGRWAQSSSSG
jgi:hypothetical protein